MFALGQRLRHSADHVTQKAGVANGERVRRWVQEKKAGWYAVLADPQMPVMSTVLDQAHNTIERKLCMMKGFHHPKGNQQAFCAGSPICTTWSPISGALSMPANVVWKSKEEPSQHATGSSTCKSSRQEAFNER